MHTEQNGCWRVKVPFRPHTFVALLLRQDAAGCEPLSTASISRIIHVTGHSIDAFYLSSGMTEHDLKKYAEGWLEKKSNKVFARLRAAHASM